MDEYYENEKYATIGHAPAQPWEILSIWLYLVSLTPSSQKEIQKTIKTNSPPRQPSHPPTTPSNPSSPPSPNAHS